ncbi:MAG TPA: helix-turn-helix domain-containing protein [Allosphingosinicella sp.]|nr:helix-turn-helix domain-containing protein [Allosphingosinicella sp.]
MKEEDFQALVQSFDDVRRFLGGEEVPGLPYHPAPSEDARAIRKRTGLSQPAFARQMRVSVATLRSWEQRRRRPDGPARVLLALLAKDPGIVARTLSEAA